jgi:hypothetical protein
MEPVQTLAGLTTQAAPFQTLDGFITQADPFQTLALPAGAPMPSSTAMTTERMLVEVLWLGPFGAEAMA